MEKYDVERHNLQLRDNQYVLSKLGERWHIHYGDKKRTFLHYHNLFEIGYCYNGDGKITIGNQEYRYAGNCYTIIPSNLPHTTESASGKVCKWEFIFVDMDSFVKNEMKDFCLPPDKIQERINSKGLMLGISKNMRLGEIIKQLLAESKDKGSFYDYSIVNMLKLLVVEILKLRESEEEYGYGGNSEIHIEQAIIYINGNYMNEIKIDKLAHEVGLSQTHFRRTFEAMTHYKPHEYINKVRINEACRLIVTNKYSMADIGYMVGFNNSYSFNRNFKYVTGTTPYQWKKSVLEEGKPIEMLLG